MVHMEVTAAYDVSRIVCNSTTQLPEFFLGNNAS